MMCAIVLGGVWLTVKAVWVVGIREELVEL